MKNIILICCLITFSAYTQINPVDRDYNSIQNRSNRGELGYKPTQTTSSTNKGYSPNTAHYNTYAPVNTEMTKAQIESFDKLFGLNRKSQSQIDSAYYANLRSIEKERNERTEFKKRENDLKNNMHSMTYPIVNAVNEYINTTLLFLKQNNDFTKAKCIKGNGQNGFLTYKGSNYTMNVDVKNGIKNGFANITYQNAPFTQINSFFSNDELQGRATLIFSNDDKEAASHINLNFQNNKIINKMTVFYKAGAYVSTTIINNKINGIVSTNNGGGYAECIYHLGEFKTLLYAYNPHSEFSYWPKSIYKNAKNEEIEWSEKATKTIVETAVEGTIYTTTTKTVYGKNKPKLFAAWKNGTSYYGTFNGIKMSGGTYVEKTGWIYEGEMSNDKFSGIGTISWTDGSTYTGEWKNDARNGEGTLTKANGFYKKGTFKDNEDKNVKYYNAKNEEITKEKYAVFIENGYGQEQINDEESYEGNYANGKRNGKGKYLFKGGIYKGDFVDGMYNGQGIKTFDNGNSYNGNFINFNFYGKGKYFWNDGTIYEGDFENNGINGNGVKSFKNGTSIKGTFMDWEPNDVKYYNNIGKEISKTEFEAI